MPDRVILVPVVSPFENVDHTSIDGRLEYSGMLPALRDPEQNTCVVPAGSTGSSVQVSLCFHVPQSYGYVEMGPDHIPRFRIVTVVQTFAWTHTTPGCARKFQRVVGYINEKINA